ncbi:cytochrome d ubiquinol oxidase subunit II [Kitasatospora sp. NPDC094011]|uniref:cytochrome d ubiquinol oxidase subunit II n=1 Tax=Kitasatospora sp. NPDC094011 TaxID=3364090 RepID=UPI00381459E8
MDIFWYALVGLLMVGYLTLEGTDFGVGMLLPFARGEADRARMRRSVVPLFLANEVWLVAFVGLLFGALPLLEGELLSALRIPVTLLLLAWFLRDAALWFRSALPGAGWRRAWDAVLPVASLVLAAGWGVVLSVLIRGMSTGDLGRPTATLGDLLHPFTLGSAAVMVLASLRQGLFFTALSGGGDNPLGERADLLAKRLTPALAGLILVTAVIGLVTCDAKIAVAINGLLPAVAVLGSGRDHAKGRTARALARGTAPLIAMPVSVGIAHGGTVLATRSGVGQLSLDTAVAASSTLTLLAVVVLPGLVAVAFAQAWFWRVFTPLGRTPEPAAA